MKVQCIESDHAFLTVGQTYTVIRETDSFYYLQEYAGHQSSSGGWYKDRFKIVEPRQKANDPFAGKTILRVNKNSVNVMKFYFTDGTGVELWAECGSVGYAIPYHEVKKFTYKLRKCGRIGKVTYTP